METEEAIPTPVPTLPDVVVIEVPEEEGFKFILTGEGAVVIVVVMAIVGLLLAIRRGQQKGNIPEEVATYAREKYADEKFSEGVEWQFKRLSPVNQHRIQQFINILDPLTPFVPGDLDSDSVAWLRKVTDGLPNITIVPTGSLTQADLELLKREIISGIQQAATIPSQPEPEPRG